MVIFGDITNVFATNIMILFSVLALKSFAVRLTFTGSYPPKLINSIYAGGKN